MNNNRILKLICSIPIIIGVGYFIPFVGICLIIMRYFVYNNKKYYYTPSILIIIGILILIPKAIPKILEITKTENSDIAYLNTIINSPSYHNLINYSKFLITTGIVFLLLSIIFKKLLNKLSSFIRNHINNREQIDSEIRQKNDMEMKIKQEKSKNTNVIHCSHCGADNIVSETIGICKYCRRNLDNKTKKYRIKR